MANKILVGAVAVVLLVGGGILLFGRGGEPGTESDSATGPMLDGPASTNGPVLHGDGTAPGGTSAAATGGAATQAEGLRGVVRHPAQGGADREGAGSDGWKPCFPATAWPQDASEMTGSHTQLVDIDASGAFTVPGLPTLATVQLRVVGDGVLGAPSVHHLIPDMPAPSVRLSYMRQGERVHVEVVRAEDGAPIRRAWVSWAHYPEVGVEADSQGRASIPTWAESPITLSAVADGFVEGILEVKPADAGGDVVMRLQRALTVTGIVVDAHGQPVADAVVTASTELSPARTTTDAEGRYVFTHAKRGENDTLSVSHPERGSVHVPLLVEELAEDVSEIELDVQLGAVGTLVGRVLAPDGSPQVRALVRAHAGILDFHEAFTDADGRYVLEGVLRSRIRLSAEAHGTSSPELRFRFTEETQEAPDLHLAVERVLRGRVVDPAGSPISDVYVAAGAGHPSYTDADGRFELRRLPRRSLRVRVFKRGYARQVVEEEEPPLESIEIRMVPELVLAGHVVDAQTGAPVEDFLIRVIGGHRGFGAPSGGGAAPGSFITESLSPGRDEEAKGGTLMLLSAEGYAPRLLPCTPTTAPDPMAWRIELGRGGELVGRVVDVEGGAISGATLLWRWDPSEILEAAGQQARLVRYLGDVHGGTDTDPTGAFRLTGIPEGQVRLVVEAEGYVSSEPSIVAFEAGPRQTREFVLSRGATARGQAAPGATVTLSELDRSVRENPIRARVQADAEGAFAFTGLRDGRYSLRQMLEREGHLDAVASFQVIDVRDGTAPSADLVRRGDAGVKGPDRCERAFARRRVGRALPIRERHRCLRVARRGRRRVLRLPRRAAGGLPPRTEPPHVELRAAVAGGAGDRVASGCGLRGGARDHGPLIIFA